MSAEGSKASAEVTEESDEIQVTKNEEESKSSYYFAYGSNNNSTRMKERGVIFSKRQVAHLKDYEFVLNKTIPDEHKARLPDGVAAANIRPAQGKTVYGMSLIFFRLIMYVIVYGRLKTEFWSKFLSLRMPLASRNKHFLF